MDKLSEKVVKVLEQYVKDVEARRERDLNYMGYLSMFYGVDEKEEERLIKIRQILEDHKNA